MRVITTVLALWFAFGLMLTLSVGLAGSLTVGLTATSTLGLPAGLLLWLVVGSMTGFAFGRYRAWSAYLIATFWLAQRGRLPRSLMAFLDDAHRLGLLRTVGPIYQFRHAEFHDHLAARYRSGSS